MGCPVYDTTKRWGANPEPSDSQSQVVTVDAGFINSIRASITLFLAYSIIQHFPRSINMLARLNIAGRIHSLSFRLIKYALSTDTVSP